MSPFNALCIAMCVYGMMQVTTASEGPTDATSVEVDNKVKQYYENVDTNDHDSLHNRLQATHKGRSYKQLWDALGVVDAEPNDPTSVRLIYTQTPKKFEYKEGSKTAAPPDGKFWNREHTWPQSYMEHKGKKYDQTCHHTTDLHHLFPSDKTVNNHRGNMFFDECTIGEGDCKAEGGDAAEGTGVLGDKAWMPPAVVRGDVARAFMYMALRYDADQHGCKAGTVTGDMTLTNCVMDGGSKKVLGGVSQFAMGKLSTLLKWHTEDPVSDWERQRHEKAFELQKNRNPFIDFPDLAEVHYGKNYKDLACEQQEEIGSPAASLSADEQCKFKDGTNDQRGKVECETKVGCSWVAEGAGYCSAHAPPPSIPTDPLAAVLEVVASLDFKQKISVLNHALAAIIGTSEDTPTEKPAAVKTHKECYHKNGQNANQRGKKECVKISGCEWDNTKGGGGGCTTTNKPKDEL